MRSSRRAIALVAIAGLLPIGVLASLAFFVDSAEVPDNTFAVQYVELTVSPTSAVITVTDLAPGEKIVAPVTISNSGSADLRYSLTAASDASDTAGLGGHLTATINTQVTACTAAGATTGTSLYGPGAFAPTTGRALIGDPATGGQAGDRPLAPAASETLCLAVTRPPESTTSFDGLTTTVTLTFNAEQTRNNP